MLTGDVASKRPTPTVYQSAGSESDSDGYVNARKNIPSKAQKRRQMLIAAGELPPSTAEVRFSSRSRPQVVNYNEEEEDDFEDDDDEKTPDYGYVETVEDTGPAIDKVLDHRPKEGVGKLPLKMHQVSDADLLQTWRSARLISRTSSTWCVPALPTPLRNLLTASQIKWQGKAHYHSTWEPYEVASGYKGYRKLDNYFKGPVMTDIHYIHRKHIDPEEYEQYVVTREAERQSQADFHIVERVIGARDGEEETEYYVKCKHGPSITRN